jgi:hypothetical protein
MQTIQRIGTDLPETVLRFDSETRLLSLCGLREEFEVANVGTAILRALADKSMTEPEIDGAIEGKNAAKRRALRELTGNGTIVRSGSGKRGDPFHYESACTPVPAPVERIGDKKPNEGFSGVAIDDGKNVVPASRNVNEYKSTSNCSPAEGSVNIDEKVVPANTINSLYPEKPGTAASEEVWL